jgi:hypothetical protein
MPKRFAWVGRAVLCPPQLSIYASGFTMTAIYRASVLDCGASCFFPR